jgi:hypothetical protein
MHLQFYYTHEYMRVNAMASPNLRFVVLINYGRLAEAGVPSIKLFCWNDGRFACE